MPSRLAVLALVLVAAACVPPKTYNVTQTGLVPAPRPMAYDGQPMDGWFRVEGRAATVATPIEQTGAGNAGSLIARHYTGVALRGGIGATDVGLEIDAVWTSGAEPVADQLGPPPDVDHAISRVFTIRHSFRASDVVRIGLGAAIGAVNVPIRVGLDELEYDQAGIYQLALVPSWRRGPLSIHGGVTATQEIKVPRTLTYLTSQSADGVAYADHGALVLSAGLTRRLARGMRLTTQVALPVAAHFADHGLQLEVGLGFDLGRLR